jgi:hypothetical protein
MNDKPHLNATFRADNTRQKIENEFHKNLHRSRRCRDYSCAWRCEAAGSNAELGPQISAQAIF